MHRINRSTLLGVACSITRDKGQAAGIAAERLGKDNPSSPCSNALLYSALEFAGQKIILNFQPPDFFIQPLFRSLLLLTPAHRKSFAHRLQRLCLPLFNLRWMHTVVAGYLRNALAPSQRLTHNLQFNFAAMPLPHPSHKIVLSWLKIGPYTLV
jgi:hypothetical protein